MVALGQARETQLLQKQGGEKLRSPCSASPALAQAIGSSDAAVLGPEDEQIPLSWHHRAGMSHQLWKSIRPVCQPVSSLELGLQQEVKVEHFNLGGLFIFTVVPSCPPLEGERNIGLEVVQEKLFELCTTGPHHFTLVLDSDTMSSTCVSAPCKTVPPSWSQQDFPQTIPGVA